MLQPSCVTRAADVNLITYRVCMCASLCNCRVCRAATPLLVTAGAAFLAFAVFARDSAGAVQVMYHCRIR